MAGISIALLQSMITYLRNGIDNCHDSNFSLTPGNEINKLHEHLLVEVKCNLNIRPSQATYLNQVWKAIHIIRTCIRWRLKIDRENKMTIISTMTNFMRDARACVIISNTQFVEDTGSMEKHV